MNQAEATPTTPEVGICVEIRGGMCVAVYKYLEGVFVKVTVLDWDNIKTGDGWGETPSIAEATELPPNRTALIQAEREATYPLEIY